MRPSVEKSEPWHFDYSPRQVEKQCTTPITHAVGKETRPKTKRPPSPCDEGGFRFRVWCSLFYREQRPIASTEHLREVHLFRVRGQRLVRAAQPGADLVGVLVAARRQVGREQHRLL